MNLNQAILLVFALIVAAITLWAIWTVIRSPDLKLKPLWLMGSLFGFIGLGIDWGTPTGLVLLFGVTIPPVTGFFVPATGSLVVKTGFPVVAAIALAEARRSAAKRDAHEVG